MSVATAGHAVRVEEPDSSPSQRSRTARGFGALVVTQFFGATNDNILKGVLIYMVIHGSWTGQLGSGGQGTVSLCLTLPFLLLSGVAGQVADRHSKRDISVLMKVSSHSGLILAAGFSAGFYIIPLQALLQQLSPRSERGRFLGTANAISFAFLTAAALLYSMIRPAFTESETVQHPERIFLVCAALMAAGIVFFLMQVKARGLSLNPVTTHDQQ